MGDGDINSSLMIIGENPGEDDNKLINRFKGKLETFK